MYTNISKEQEEINLLLLQQKDLRSRLILDWFKALGIFIGAVVAFMIIQAPDFEHKRDTELTKLYFQAITIEDNKTRALALGYLRKELQFEVENPITPLAISAECSAVELAKYAKLILEIKKIEQLISNEVAGSSNNKPGKGPVYYHYSSRAELLRNEVKQMKEQLSFCNLKPYP